MRFLYFIYTLLFSAFWCGAQNLYLKAEGANAAETAVIDSLGYIKNHENAKAVEAEAANILQKLSGKGYLEAREVAHQKINDTTFVYAFSIATKTDYIHIYTTTLTDAERQLLDIAEDTIVLATGTVKQYMENRTALLEKKGYSLSSLQLTGHEKKGNIITAAIKAEIEKKRTLDGLVIEGYTKFPEGLRRSILKKYSGKTFNRENLQRVYNDFNAIKFVSQVRYPEILFKEDTTKVYVYLEKAKPNSFDGFIGFSNDEDEGNVRFNGYLDLLLVNVLNSGERFNLYWKNNGDEQTTFNAQLELPYIFKSPIGLKGSLNIFKQDSTFQNTVTDLNAGYYFSYNSKVFLGYRRTQSVDIQNLDNTTLSDYSSTFWTSTYEHTGYTFDDYLFPEKTRIMIKGGIGSRNTKATDTGQFFLQADVSHNLYLNKRNIIAIRNESYYLDSNTYIINELYRFGGINSVRGFNENSLQASLYTALLAEYRYILAPNMYLYSITDYGYFQDKTSNFNDNLLGLGFGFGLLTKNGLFNIIYANGSTGNQSIKLSNSIVHLSFKAVF
ncbi:hypothetical protein [Flavobacterium sp.]|uniref:hypothetical protein n=1 Tax=Flavobacterium sp. TaxID=239 RepID=UPI002623B663|nr:hypothetical protein [Flavobacterium sp.]